MSLLLTASELAARRVAAASAGSAIASLAASLRADLDAARRHDLAIPTEKARLSKRGGRCPDHHVALEFDPFSPHAHRCPVDGAVHRGEVHDRLWIMWYQLWLAERAVHAAALSALTGDAALRDFAARVLDGYAEQYLRYPNRDNALGPSRPFFSTYLESIWLLQLCVALDLLEMTGDTGATGAALRDRVIEPSVALIASFDEGRSNRQVWNDAALLAVGALLGRDASIEHAIDGPSGLVAHLRDSLLADGTWYEGENYHFFAHRGLWYLVTMAEQRGAALPAPLVARFQEAFATPLATALPDLTFPSRRDSQYGISLRQWRFAESCELGLSRADDARIAGALHAIYEAGDLPRRDTGRWRSTAEAERNEPPSRLGRADLGWRSLLRMRETLPSLEPSPPRSVLLEEQGLAVFRRDAGRTYVALDYGHSGGGHGHPDRLGLLLMVDNDRWLDDMGTGSYVERTLHWYRSTLAHNAPLIDGRSQSPADGILRAYDERGGIGWVDAEAPAEGVAPGVRLRRSLVVMPDYVVDRLEWEADRAATVDLPLHLDAALVGTDAFEAAPLAGGDALEDGFAFVGDTSVMREESGAVLRFRRRDHDAAWLSADGPLELWRARAPGPPAAPGSPPTGDRSFFIARARGRGGTFVTIYSWADAVSHVSAEGILLMIGMRDGSRHEHRPAEDAWLVAFFANGARSSVELRGSRAHSIAPRAEAPGSAPEPELLPCAPLPPRTFELGEDAYRVSEETWAEAGYPRATVSLRVEDGMLAIGVTVAKAPLVFRAADAPDPELDNEHPDINSDGVQLHLSGTEWPAPAAWLAVPDPRTGAVRVRAADGSRGDIPLDAAWHPTADGYAVRFAIPLDALGECRENPLGVQVVVNDMGAERERRRGQLVLHGGAGEYVYLRGDREAPSRFLQFLLPRG